MGDKNAIDPISIPLPKWPSFQSDSCEPGSDFPAGPYNRMVAKLYGMGGQRIYPADEGRLGNPPIRFYPVGVQPSLSIDEPRQETVGTSLYSQGKLTHSLDETKQDNASVRFGFVGVQPRHSIDAAVLEAASSRSYSGGQHIQSLEKIRRDDAFAALYPAGVLGTGGAKKEDEPARLYSGGNLIPSVNETRPGAASVRFYPVGVECANAEKQETASTALLSGGNLKPSVDETKRGAASVRFYPVGVECANQARQEAASTVLLSGGSQLMQGVDKIRQEDASSRFFSEGVHSADGARQDDDPARLPLADRQSKDLPDEAKLDAVPGRLGSADGQPVDLVPQEKLEKAPSTIVSAGGKPLEHGDKGKPMDHGDKGKTLEHGDKGKPMEHGDKGKPSEHGDKGKPMEHGDKGKPSEHGDKGKPMEHGDKGKPSEHGDKGKPMEHGDKGKTLEHGDKGKTLEHGDKGKPMEHGGKAKVDSAPAGVIFMCNNKTRSICFQYSLFGLPAMHSKMVQRIVPETKLFLFVLDSRELHGVFEAASNGGHNLEPKAFSGSFPAQVRFRILKECKPLAERVFKKAIEANYFKRNKFTPELTSEQVADLLQMFCPGESLDKKVEAHETLQLDHTDAHGKTDGAALEIAECQSELSMEISPQSSPPVDSFQRSQYPPLMESQRGAQPHVMETSKENSHLLMDVQGIRGQAAMEDLRVGGQGLLSLPMELSRNYYSPSVERSILNKAHFLDVREDFQIPLTEDPRLVQFVGFQKTPESYLGEASRQDHYPMVDQPASVHNVDMRSRFENSSYALETSKNGLRGSLQLSSVYSSGLQSQASGGQGQKLNHVQVERGNLSLQAAVTGNTHLMEQNRLLYEMDHSNIVEGQVYTNELDVARQQQRVHLDRALRMFEKEVEQNMNPHGEQLDSSHATMFGGRDRQQDDVEGKPVTHSLPVRPADTSSFQMYKRMPEDPVGSFSNSYPWKRLYYYNESFGDKMAEGISEGRFPYFNEAATDARLTDNSSHAGDSADELSSRRLFSNIASLHDSRELGRSYSSQPGQASGLISLPTAMARSTFPVQRY